MWLCFVCLFFVWFVCFDLLQASGALSSTNLPPLLLQLLAGELVCAAAKLGVTDDDAAVAYLHEHDVVHGNIAPAAVLMTSDGKTVLAGMGFARACLLERRTRDRCR